MVTDFGLARSLGSAERGVLTGLRGSDVTTRTRGVFGTPAYMARKLSTARRRTRRVTSSVFAWPCSERSSDVHPFGADGGVGASELISRMREAQIDFSGKRLPLC